MEQVTLISTDLGFMLGAPRSALPLPRSALFALRSALKHSALMNRVVVDMELGRGFGYGFRDLVISGFSIAVTWDDVDGFIHWDGAYGRDLLDYLVAHDEIVGFNLLSYDNKVLAGYLLPTERHLVAELTRKTVDLYALIYRETGQRWSLERLAQTMLGSGKLAVPDHGDIDDLAAYCERDVELTRDLDDLRRVNGDKGVGSWALGRTG